MKKRLLQILSIVTYSFAFASDLTFHESVRALEAPLEEKEHLINLYENAVIDALVHGQLEEFSGSLDAFSYGTVFHIYLAEDRKFRKKQWLWFDRPERWNSRFSISDADYISDFLKRLDSAIKEGQKEKMKFNEDGHLSWPSSTITREDPLLKLETTVFQFSVLLEIGEHKTSLLITGPKKSKMRRTTSMNFNSPPNVIDLVNELSDEKAHSQAGRLTDD